MHTYVIIAVVGAMVLLAGAAGTWLRLRARRRHRVSGDELRRRYPDLDRELDRIWDYLYR